MEDAAWLMKQDDCYHINVAELDVVWKGLNLALRRRFLTIEIRTDVFRRAKSVITGEWRVRTKGDADMLIKRGLRILVELA